MGVCSTNHWDSWHTINTKARYLSNPSTFFWMILTEQLLFLFTLPKSIYFWLSRDLGVGFHFVYLIFWGWKLNIPWHHGSHVGYWLLAIRSPSSPLFHVGTSYGRTESAPQMSPCYTHWTGATSKPATPDMLEKSWHSLYLSLSYSLGNSEHWRMCKK